MLRAAVDTDALLELVWVAPLAVATVTVAWAMVIHGATRAADARGQGRSVAAGAHFLVALLGALLFAAAIVFGIVIMSSE